jgi:hypothetical protein
VVIGGWLFFRRVLRWLAGLAGCFETGNLTIIDARLTPSFHVRAFDPLDGPSCIARSSMAMLVVEIRVHFYDPADVGESTRRAR